MARETPQVERFEGVVAAVNAALAAPRLAFEQWLIEVGADPEVRAELAIVFSELMANAAGAIADGSPETITVGAWAEDGAVLLEVANPLPGGFDAVTRWDLDDPLRGGGRGLLIVRAYTDDLEIETVDGAIVVRCRRDLHAA